MIDYSGNVFRIVRKDKKMTQKMVCEGICELRHYQRIEKNETHASTYIMSRICERLGINIFDYVRYSADENVYHIKNTFDQVYYHLYRFQFQEAYDLVVNDEALNKSEIVNVIQTREYVKLMAGYYAKTLTNVNKNSFLELLKYTNPISKIEELFDRPISEVEYRILNSYASYLFDLKKFDQGRDLLFKIIGHMETSQVTDDYHVIYCKLCQNLGRIELARHDYRSAFDITKKGIYLSIQKSNLFVFEGLCNIHGKAMYHLEGSNRAKEYIMAYIAIIKVVKPNIDFENITKELANDYQIDLSVYC
jgi:transcriptional regulator with XRE-family HTH domain